MATLCVVAIFKNEAHIMKEWLDHYINQGVNYFFLINNGSTDAFRPILKPYLDQNLVTLARDFRQGGQMQNDAYNMFYLEIVKRNYDWVMICDFDEFIYARNGFRKINEFLDYLPRNVSQINIPYKMFGSNGYDSIDIAQPASVVRSFTKRANGDDELPLPYIFTSVNGVKYIEGKSITRCSMLNSLEMHTSSIKNGLRICPNGSPSQLYYAIGSYAHYRVSEEILHTSFLHCNHYILQSKNWFYNVKMTRGDAHHSSNKRDENYYHTYNSCSNTVEDFELAQINMFISPR